jgi:hypothetical protein
MITSFFIQVSGQLFYCHKYYSEHKNALILLDWPRCFRDVMPVESLWKQMLNNLTENKIKVFSENKLWEEIYKVWHKFV